MKGRADEKGLIRDGRDAIHGGAAASPAAAARSTSGSTDAGPPAAVGFLLNEVVRDVLREPARHGLSEPVDLVTITPPYEEVVYAELLDALASSPAVGEDTLALIEYPVELGVLPPVLADGRLVGLRNRRYGRTVLALYVNRPSGRLDMQPFSEEFVLQPKWEKKQARRAKKSAKALRNTVGAARRDRGERKRKRAQAQAHGRRA